MEKEVPNEFRPDPIGQALDLSRKIKYENGKHYIEKK
jgi:hypothetical protein